MRNCCIHTVNFGTTTGEPSCTVEDTMHAMQTVFKFFGKWGWESLPEQYMSQPHISSDARALTNSVTTPSSPHTETISDELPFMEQDQMELPTKTVSCNDVTN
jgi:hypothetical protein